MGSPCKCVLSRPRFNAYTYMINKSGIPSEDRSQFEREEQQCVQKRYIATPIEQLLHNIYSKTQTQARKHIVIKQLTKTCISKTMVNVCSKYQSEERQSAQQSAEYENQLNQPHVLNYRLNTRNY